MKHQFAPALLCALSLAACGSQSGVIGERRPGIDNQSVGDGLPDAGTSPQTDPPEELDVDAGNTQQAPDPSPSSDNPSASTPGATGTANSDPLTPGPTSTVSAPGSQPAPSSDATDAGAPDEHLSPPDEPCSDDTPIDVPAEAVAERLAQLIVSGPPDEALLDAAADGHLNTYGQVECEARRLAALPESTLAVTQLLQSWLAFDDWPGQRDPSVGEELWSQMNTEATDYLARVAAPASGTLAALLQGTEGLVGAELAAHYGATLPEGETEAVVEIPSRVGVLSLGRVTAGLQRIAQRGVWILERFECAQVGPPDPSSTVLPPVEGSTYRESYESTVSPATCQGCHTMFDGPGFALENFSSDGRYVLEEAGQPVDTSGYFPEISETGMIERVAVSDATELAARMLQSPTVGRCLSKRAFDYALGADAGDDAVQPSNAEIQRISTQFEVSEGDLRELLIAVTQSRTFWQGGSGGGD